MSEYEVETFEHAGLECKIVQDVFAEDPRDMRDEITRWIWGPQFSYLAKKHDEHIDFDHYSGRGDWTPAAIAARWLTLCDGYGIVVPFRIEERGPQSRAYLTDIDDDRPHGFVGILHKHIEEERAHGQFDPQEYIKSMFG